MDFPTPPYHESVELPASNNERSCCIYINLGPKQQDALSARMLDAKQTTINTICLMSLYIRNEHIDKWIIVSKQFSPKVKAYLMTFNGEGGGGSGF